MTNLEKLNEENRDMSLENLTDEQASAAIKFSPELAGGEMGRMEYLKNLVNKIDINVVKKVITEPNFDLLDEKELLMNDYGFTEKEIAEGVAHLEEVRANPDMLEYDIENEVVPFPRLLVIAIAACVGTGSAVSQCSREQEKQEELRDKLERLKKENRKEDEKEEKQLKKEEKEEEKKLKKEERKLKKEEKKEERKLKKEEKKEERKLKKEKKNQIKF